MNVKPLNEEFQAKYLEYWRTIFLPQYSGHPASFVFIEEPTCSGYRPIRDQLVLALCGWDLEGICTADGTLIEPSWEDDITWRRELVHELCHEVQSKLGGFLDAAEGEQFRDKVGELFPGDGHDGTFYSAVIYVAGRFKISADLLVRRI